jgi:hypothetical protein
MEFGVFIPIANGGSMMSGTSPKEMPTFELDSEICTGSCGSRPRVGALQLNGKPADSVPLKQRLNAAVFRPSLLAS